MSWQPITHIAKEAGVCTKTVNAACEKLEKRREGRKILIDTRDAYRAIFQKKTKESLDLNEERARLAAAQADKYELEVARTRKEQLTREEVESLLIDCASSVRAKLLALGPKLTRVAYGAESLAEVEREVNKQIDQALAELEALSIE